MGDIFNAITKTMGIIVCWINTPLIFCSMMRNKFDSIETWSKFKISIALNLNNFKLTDMQPDPFYLLPV